MDNIEDQIEELNNQSLKEKQGIIVSIEETITSIIDNADGLNKGELKVLNTEIKALQDELDKKISRIDLENERKIKDVQDQNVIDVEKEKAEQYIADAKEVRDYIIDECNIKLDSYKENIQILNKNRSKLELCHDDVVKNIKEKYLKEFELICIEENKKDPNFERVGADTRDKATVEILNKILNSNGSIFEDEMKQIKYVSKKEMLQDEINIEENKKLAEAKNIYNEFVEKYNNEELAINSEIEDEENKKKSANKLFEEKEANFKNEYKEIVESLNISKRTKYNNSKYAGRFDFVLKPLTSIISKFKDRGFNKVKESIFSLNDKNIKRTNEKEAYINESKSKGNSFLDDLKSKKKDFTNIKNESEKNAINEQEDIEI